MNRKIEVDFTVKSTDSVWTEVPCVKIMFVNKERFDRVTYAEVTNISKLAVLRIHKIWTKLVC